MPEGELDYSGYLELGNVDLSTYGGWVFAWEREASALTRYGVRADFSLFRSGEQLSFQSHSGGGEFVGGELAFISATRAYALSSELDLVVVWDPTTMEITGTIPMEPPNVPAGFVPFAHHPAVVGDKVIWEIVATNDETEEIHRSVMLAVASAETDEPVRYATDERCAGANGGHRDERGDYYVRADGYWGKYAAYGARASEVGTCVLRIPRWRSGVRPGLPGVDGVAHRQPNQLALVPCRGRALSRLGVGFRTRPCPKTPTTTGSAAASGRCWLTSNRERPSRIRTSRER